MEINRWLKATLMMVAAELVIATFSVSYKLAAEDGMRMGVLITYRYLFAGLSILPLALTLERNKRPKLTRKILIQSFLCAIFGGPLSQNMFAKSLTLTSATFTAAFTNLIPPFTFIVVVLLGLEKVAIGKVSGKAKIIGTLIGVGGAMILTLYKGQQLKIRPTHFSLVPGGQRMDGHVAATHKASDHIFGSLLAFVYSIAVACYYVIQSKLTVIYPCHYSNTFLFCVLGFIQSLLYAVVTDRSWSQWKLGSKIRLLSALFQGISSVVGVFLIMAAMHLQGPLFVSAFNPLLLVFVAIAGFLVLDEKLYMGSVLGSVVVIAGLYLVLWGKSKDTRMSKVTSSESPKDVDVVSNTKADTVTLDTTSMARTSSANVDEGDELPAVKTSWKKHNEQDIAEEV